MLLRGLINQEDSYWRETGYKSALSANGIPFDERLVLNGDFERDTAYKVLSEFIAAQKQVSFDAVFTGNDDAAIGVLKALHENGCRVPEDVSVIGFDNLEFSAFLTPATYHGLLLPLRMLVESRQNNYFPSSTNSVLKDVTLLPTELIIRGSCGCNYMSAIQ